MIVSIRRANKIRNQNNHTGTVAIIVELHGEIAIVLGSLPTRVLRLTALLASEVQNVWLRHNTV